MFKKIIPNAIINALVATLYVSIVAVVMTNAEKWVDPKPGIIGPIAFLLTFVISAAVMGLLVFGRPIMWYLDGNKKEAVQLILCTIASLIVIATIAFFFLAVRQ